MKYRVNTYLTINGIIDEVTLPDSAYGEWVVYDKKEPKFHVKVFNSESKSDAVIFGIMTRNKSGFGSVLAEINQRINKELSINPKTSFGIRISSQMAEIELGPLPFEWIDHHVEFIKPPWEIYPHIDPSDMFWRMGKGEDSLSIFVRYFNALNEAEKIVFMTKHTPPIEWADFYE